MVRLPTFVHAARFRLQEIKNLSLSLNSLKVAQARFTESANALAAIPSDGEGAFWGCLSHLPSSAGTLDHPTFFFFTLTSHIAGREALIPLTPSLFVSGTLGGPGEVLVDIGTGFFVGKQAPAAVSLLRARADAVGGEVGGLARVLSVKESNREVIQQRLSMFEQPQQS